MRRGEAHFSVGQYEPAVGWFVKAAANRAFDLADQAWMRQADCQAQLKRFGKAADLYAGLAREFPNSARIEEANLAAGKCYYLAGNWAKSLDVLTKVIAARGTSLPEATHWSRPQSAETGQAGRGGGIVEPNAVEGGG